MSKTQEVETGVQVQSSMKPSVIKRLNAAADVEGRSLSNLIARVMERWVTVWEKKS